MRKRRSDYYKRPSNYIPKQYEPTVLAYMAGIVDGEGCLYIGQVRRNKSGEIKCHHIGCLKIDSADKVLIDWLLDTFSGTNSARNRWTSKRKYKRTIHTWVATGDRLLDLCEQILPYLTIKKRHCENMIRFRKTFKQKLGGNTPVPKEIFEEREACLKISRNLNSRWHNHPLKK